MKFDVAYAENIIVGTVHDKKWVWYVSEVDTWILDSDKFSRAFGQFDVSNTFDWNNENAVEKFLYEINDESVEKYELSELLSRKLPVYDWDDLIEFCPSLYVNFDEKILKSLYPENTKFEEFVPDKWTGHYEDFLSEIPNEEKYWIIEGVDYFKPFLT